MTDRDTMWASASGQATRHLWVGGQHDPRYEQRWWSAACGTTNSRWQDELRDEPAKPRCLLCERTRLARAVANAGSLA